MIKEAYVGFEVAKLLKEKGFNEPCQYFYKFGSNELYKGTVFTNTQIGDIFYNAPTHQMAMAYLREKYGIFIAINNDDLDSNWQCYDLINRGSTLDPKILSESYGGFKHYEDAVEAALKYSLENLI